MGRLTVVGYGFSQLTGSRVRSVLVDIVREFGEIDNFWFGRGARDVTDFRGTLAEVGPFLITIVKAVRHGTVGDVDDTGGAGVFDTGQMLYGWLGELLVGRVLPMTMTMARVRAEETVSLRVTLETNRVKHEVGNITEALDGTSIALVCVRGCWMRVLAVLTHGECVCRSAEG